MSAENVRIFPLSRSAGRIAEIANAIDVPIDAEADAAWRRACIALGRELLDQGVPDSRVDLELLLLLRAAQAVVAERRATQERKAARARPALRIVVRRPEQLELFDLKPSPAKVPAPIAGEISNVG